MKSCACLRACAGAVYTNSLLSRRFVQFSTHRSASQVSEAVEFMKDLLSPSKRCRGFTEADHRALLAKLREFVTFREVVMLAMDLYRPLDLNPGSAILPLLIELGLGEVIADVYMKFASDDTMLAALSTCLSLLFACVCKIGSAAIYKLDCRANVMASTVFCRCYRIEPAYALPQMKTTSSRCARSRCFATCCPLAFKQQMRCPRSLRLYQ